DLMIRTVETESFVAFSVGIHETPLAVWRGLRAFEGRSSLRTWLLRVATSRCLSALRDAGRRPKEVPMPSTEHRVPSRADPDWLQPYPDILLVDLPDRTPGPEARYETRESIELAFIVGLQQNLEAVNGTPIRDVKPVI